MRTKIITSVSVLFFASAATMAQTRAGVSPWVQAADMLADAFTGPIARGLTTVAICIAGLLIAYGEGQSKKLIAGLLFGGGMAIAAPRFLDWLF